MRVLRSTMYPPDKSIGNQMTVTMRESDLRSDISIEDIVSGKESAPDHFSINEIFEAPDGTDYIKLSLMAQDLQENGEEEEWHMALLYYWTCMQLDTVLRAGGVLSGSLPAPISAKRIEYVDRCIFNSLHYKGQTLITFSNDGFVVTAKTGNVTISKLGEQ